MITATRASQTSLDDAWKAYATAIENDKLSVIGPANILLEAAMRESQNPASDQRAEALLALEDLRRNNKPHNLGLPLAPGF